MPCDGACKECVGPTSNDCISCFKGDYLKRVLPTTLTVTSGTCSAKVAGPFTSTVYVKPSKGMPKYPSATTVQG